MPTPNEMPNANAPLPRGEDVERVAKVIAKAINKEYGILRFFDTESLARVAIAAMRDTPPASPDDERERIERWLCVDGIGVRGGSMRQTQEMADKVRIGWDENYPDDAPHRVVRLVELRDGETIQAARASGTGETTEARVEIVAKVIRERFSEGDLYEDIARAVIDALGKEGR